MMFGKWNLGHWLVISIAIHVLAVSPFALAGLHPSQKPVNTKLQIELFGMVTDRQVAEKKLGEDKMPEPVRPVPPPPVVKPQAKKLDVKRPKEKEQKPIESPVKVEKEATEETPEAPPVAQNTLQAGADADQRQQTIQHELTAEDLKNIYLRETARRLRENLVYPKEVRKSGIEGVTKIAFVVTESGGIKDGSLKVYRSSGFVALDEKALDAVRASVPFDKPPKEMLIVTELEFSMKMAQSST